MTGRMIEFSAPDISEEDIQEVAEVLRSGWITTGPRTREFEKSLSMYLGTGQTLCLNSATAALELSLRILDIGPGDEVITSAYTYTATASAILHTGARLVLADTEPGGCHLSLEQVRSLLTHHTRAVIGVDVGGILCDYQSLIEAVSQAGYKGKNPYLLALGRPAVIADASHSLGSAHCGRIADITCFSFHAVKNLTTGEGGAISWRKGLWADEELYRRLRVLSLHGQTKDALEKQRSGGWEYDILEPAYKCNMTDMAAALGLSQLKRYDDLLNRRREFARRYNSWLSFRGRPLQEEDKLEESSCHLYLFRMEKKGEEYRNRIIRKLGYHGIVANVHYKPLPLLTAYKALGCRMEDYPHALDYYQREITLPLHTKMTIEDVDYICHHLVRAM